MRTLTLLLTATLLLLPGMLAVVEPGFNVIPSSPLYVPCRRQFHNIRQPR